MERINIKQEVISISDDDEIQSIKKEPSVRYIPPLLKSGLNRILNLPRRSRLDLKQSMKLTIFYFEI